MLIKADTKRTGIIPKEAFVQACERAGANLTREEINKLVDYFHYGSTQIDFVRMAKDLNLSGERLDFFSNQTRRANHSNNLKMY